MSPPKFGVFLQLDMHLRWAENLQQRGRRMLSTLLTSGSLGFLWLRKSYIECPGRSWIADFLWTDYTRFLGMIIDDINQQRHLFKRTRHRYIYRLSVFCHSYWTVYEMDLLIYWRLTFWVSYYKCPKLWLFLPRLANATEDGALIAISERKFVGKNYCCRRLLFCTINHVMDNTKKPRSQSCSNLAF